MDNCIFCKIINGEIPSYTIFEDELIKIFLDINPSSNGHCLVIPKKHFVDINDIASGGSSFVLGGLRTPKFCGKKLF